MLIYFYYVRNNKQKYFPRWISQRLLILNSLSYITLYKVIEIAIELSKKTFFV